jgi:elongation of very long chain fatty acids protein 6
VSKNPIGIVFVVMNYGVHAIMYFYYFLMAVKLKPKWFNSMYITVAQISQMVVGVTMTVLNLVLPSLYDKECHVKPENNVGAMVMYGSYLLLFLQFFFKRYSGRGGKSKSNNAQKME